MIFLSSDVRIRLSSTGNFLIKMQEQVSIAKWSILSVDKKYIEIYKNNSKLISINFK